MFLFAGDKESSMEAEHEKEKDVDMKMDLHCPPVYPLPEEIKKVSEDSKIMIL